eukprot:5570201-Amphidinium_carterae.1
MDQNPVHNEVGTSTPLCCSHYRNGLSSVLNNLSWFLTRVGVKLEPYRHQVQNPSCAHQRCPT